jgi:cell division protein FtsZ
MGVGEASGDNKAKKAVEAAIESPLIEISIDGARGVLINITGGPDLTMAEIELAAQTITDLAAPDANIIFGATIDHDLKDTIKVSVIATGFDASRQRFYQNVKKPVSPVSTKEPVKSVDITSVLNNQEIPEGVDISDEFDIPSFLRNNK